MSDATPGTDVTLPRATVSPITGEVLELETARPAQIVDALDAIADLLDRISEHKAELVEELARRADRRGERKTELGGYTVEVNPPTEDHYSVRELREALAPFVEKGTIDQALVYRLIRHPPPTPKPPAVAKRELDKLWKSDDRELLAALAGVRQRAKTKRTAKIIGRPVNATAEEVTDA